MLATMKDAVQEYALWVGRDKPYTQWILSDYDSWEKNPHYIGPDQGHPEVGDPLCEVYGTFKEASTAAKNYAYGLNQALLVQQYKDQCWVVYF
jgi:hypothetical protein